GRVYLDFAGRIPTESEVRAFLADKAPERRTKLVESLLGSPHYVRHMANTWQAVMAPPAGSAQAGFRSWLETRVRENAPYDTMVRDLLTAPMYNIAYGYIYEAINPDILILTPDLKLNNPNSFNPLFNPNPVKIKLNPKVRGKVDDLVDFPVVATPAQVTLPKQAVSV